VAFFDMTAEDGSFKGRITKAVKKVCENHAIVAVTAKVGKVFMGLMYATGLVACITSLMDWEGLSDENKAVVIADCMFYGTDITKVLLKFAEKVDEAFQNGKWPWELNSEFKKQCNLAGISEGNVTLKSYKKLDLDGNTIFEVDMGEALADSVDGKLDARFKKYFNIGTKALKAFTVVLSVAGTAVLGYKLFADFRDDAPMYVKILDSIQLITGFAEMAFLVLGYAFEFSWVPIAGEIIAIVGVVLDIIALILGAVMHQQTPAEKFIKGEGHDFLSTVTIDETVIGDDDGNDDDGDHDTKMIKIRKRVKSSVKGSK